MTDEKNRKIYKLNKIRGKLLPKLYAKLCEINDWWRDKYPLYGDLICHISNVGIEIIDTGPSLTVTMHDSRGLLGFAFKIHGDTIYEGINNFEIDYKKTLEVVKKHNREILQICLKNFMKQI